MGFWHPGVCVLVYSCSNILAVVHKHLTCGPFLPTKRSKTNSGFPSQCFSPKNHFFCLLTVSLFVGSQTGPLYIKSKQRLQTETDHSRLGGDRFDKQGNLACVGWLRDEKISTPASHNLKCLYKGHKGVQSCTQPSFFSGCVLENNSACGNGRQNGTLCIPRRCTGKGVRSLPLPGSSLLVS